ncbi:MAG: hypothetical protein H6751_02490 [Candidatus Omnitrophica bacterium]|nr:hypothetical protein [Candidatus Omnitrophota bacterium]
MDVVDLSDLQRQVLHHTPMSGIPKQIGEEQSQRYESRYRMSLTKRG